jgi:hypothetical protein
MLFSACREEIGRECWIRDSDGSMVAFSLNTEQPMNAAALAARRHLRHTRDITNDAENCFNLNFLARCAAQERVFGISGLYNGVRSLSSLPIFCEQPGLRAEHNDPDKLFIESATDVISRVKDSCDLTTAGGVTCTTYLHPVLQAFVEHSGRRTGTWLDESEIVLYQEPAHDVAFMFLHQHLARNPKWRYVYKDAVVVVQLKALGGDISIGDAVWNHLAVKLVKTDCDSTETTLCVWSGEALAPHRVLNEEIGFLYPGSGDVVLAFQGRDVCAHGYDPTTLDATAASAADFRDYVRVFPQNTRMKFELEECCIGLVDVFVWTFRPSFECSSQLFGVSVCPHRDITSVPGSRV